MSCPSARCRSTARTRAARPSTRSATSPTWSRSWDSELCIQCGNCSFVCPHSVIRSRYYEPASSDGAPAGFRSAPLNGAGLPDARYTLQVYVEDCTGCGLCVEACPVSAAKASRATRRSTSTHASRCSPSSARTSRSSSSCRRTTARESTSARCAARSSWSRCSSSRAPAPAAARRRTSSSSRSCSATA